MHESTNLAINCIAIFILIVVILVIICSLGYKIFNRKERKGSYNTSTLKAPKTKSVRLKGSLQNSDYRSGKFRLHVRSGASVITPAEGITNPEEIVADIDTESKLFFSVTDSKGKLVEWLVWEDSFPYHRLSDIKNTSILYITEGGAFGENEITPNTTFHLSGRTNIDDVIFIKMAFPDGTLPYTNIEGDNTILKHTISSDEKSITVPGIPKFSRLSLIVRDKNDGPEKIVDTMKLEDKMENLWITKQGFALVPSTVF